MPGVIMDNGDRPGSHTNHNRDQRLNGVNGGSYTAEKGQDKGKGRAELQQRMTPISPTPRNGANGAFAEALEGEVFTNPPDLQERINQLPPEIAHITHGYMSLSTLLQRLAVKTHEDLKAKILELSQMPVPSSAANGNASHVTSVDDNSADNVAKKLLLLNFAQNTHADWVKALVITNWSRRSEDVSKTIDLKLYLDDKKLLYETAIHELAQLKRTLPYSRLPNPDLKTALQVLSTGKAPWMPELGYIPPPPLTPADVLETLEKLNTLLSIRMNLHEYDNTPLQFKDYTIGSGRVTFRVAGEFELDLTIADEDPDKQFWFIDFRFLFSPTLPELTPYLRYHIESRVNAVLLTDGLPGCYKLLHEMVLTHKISECRRQASDLARGKWIEGLKVEPLNRALSIQYWLDRYGKKGPKSWIILGVHSGRRKDGRYDPKATSRLFIRWFRDGKEVKDADIPFDTVNISAEALLKTVIAKHINHILQSTYEKLQPRTLFSTGEMALTLSTSSDEPSESELKIQFAGQQYLSVMIEPITGKFILGPASLLSVRTEFALNSKSMDPANEAHGYIEMLRCEMAADEIITHGLSVGWIRIRKPDLKPEELKPVFPKDTLQVAWFRRTGWSKEWFVAVSLGMSGERWWLIETAVAPTLANTGRPNAPPPELKLVNYLEIPIKATSPIPTYKFLSTLSIFAAALISHYANLKALHARRANHVLRSSKISSPIQLPSIYVKLSEILPSKNKSKRTGQPWARNVVKLTFQGLESLPPMVLQALSSPNQQGLPPDATVSSGVQPPKKAVQEETAMIVTEARMMVPVPASLSILKERVDRDIAFHAESGTFAFRLRSRIGEAVIPALVERATRIERLVEFVEVLHKHEKTLTCESVSLGEIVFSYGSSLTPASAEASETGGLVQYRAVVDFGAAVNIMTLSLEQGNPHLRIADLLAKVLNGNEGLDGVAHLLPLTLPALRALDSLEAAWTPLSDNGEALVLVRAIEWYIIRYNFLSASPESSSPPKTREVIFEIKLQQRKGEPWWFVRRTDARDREGDDIDGLLKPIWNSSGEGWKGMRVNAVAQPKGVEELLQKIDEVLRGMVSEQNLTQTQQAEAAPAPAQVPQVQAPQMAPVAPMTPMQIKAPQRPPFHTSNQQRPQHTQNQSQMQGRGNQVKPEVVEID